MLRWWEPVLVLVAWTAALAVGAALWATRPWPVRRPTPFLDPVDVVLARPTTLDTVPPPVVDGLFLKPGMRVLVGAQVLPGENGVYTVQPDSTWRRDALRVGQAAVYVRRGQTRKGTTWVVRHLDGTDHEVSVEPTTRVWSQGPLNSVWTDRGWQTWQDRQRVPVTLQGHDVYDLPWPAHDGAYRFQLGDNGRDAAADTSRVCAQLWVSRGTGCGDLRRALIVGKHPPQLQCHRDALRVRVPFPDATYTGLWLAV